MPMPSIKHINIQLLLFPLAAYIVLMVHADYLYATQEHDLFLATPAFMTDMLAQRGGLWAWMGCYLTQFFIHPWVGALMLVAVWTLTYACITSAFHLKGLLRLLAWIPTCAMLISVLDIGYWLYYLQMPGYWFAGSLSLLAVAALTWAVSKLIRRWTKAPVAWVVFIIIYLAIAQPLPVFEKSDTSEPLLPLPFIIAPLSVVLLPLTRFIHIKASVKAWQQTAVTALALLLFTTLAHLCSFRDANYHAELRMMRAVDESRWDDILADFSRASRPTNLMVVYKNIALMHTDRLTEMFSTGNCGAQPNSGDSLQVNMSHQDGAMIYYQFGQINYAYRWAMENAVEYGLKAKNLKMYVRCAIMNHEFDLAAKYISILKRTTFHRKWAMEREPMLIHAEALYRSAEYQAIAPLLDDDINTLSMDGGVPEKWILSHFSDLIRAKTPKLEDLIICTSLWTEDEYAFCVHFYNYVMQQTNRAIPELYQQAAMLLCVSEASPVQLNDFPFTPTIEARFKSFLNVYNTLKQQGMEHDDIGRKMQHDYGDTYWWYYYFYTDFHIY